MNLKEKIDYIKENKNIAIAALNGIIEQTYDLTNEYLDEKNNLKEGLTKDEKLENFMKSLRRDAIEYEKVRSKIIKNDFNLSLVEVSVVGVSFMYMMLNEDKHIKDLIEIRNIAKEGFENLVDSESEKN